jgi:curli production assembly/transport component CsgG
MVAGCQSSGFSSSLAEPPSVTPATRTASHLEDLPPPAQPVNVAVYSFPDKTGANRPNEKYADYSRAVTQGADAVVVHALKKAGKGRWFNVVERSDLSHLLRERKLISDTYAALGQNPLQRIQPLHLADFIIQGAVTSFDSSIASGGLGASYLGVGADVNHRKDYVTVVLRLTSVSNGAVLKSITANKTIYSIQVDASLFKVVSVDDILQAVAAFTKTEVTQIAVSEAIELAVYQLIREAEREGIWNTAPSRTAPALNVALPSKSSQKGLKLKPLN